MLKETHPFERPAAASSSTIEELQKAMLDARSARMRVARLKAKLLAEFDAAAAETDNQPEAAREAENGGRH